MAEKVKAHALTIKRVALSSLITVIAAEVFPIFLVTAIIWWQNKTLGDTSQWASFFSKGTFGLQDVMNMNNIGYGTGVLVATAAILGVLTLIIDEWFFSHKLYSLKNVLIMATSWSISFYVVDLLLERQNIFNSESLYSGPRILLFWFILIIPFSIYFGRKLAQKFEKRK